LNILHFQIYICSQTVGEETGEANIAIRWSHNMWSHALATTF